MLINITMIPRIKNIALKLFLKKYVACMQISRTHPNTVTSLSESQVHVGYVKRIPVSGTAVKFNCKNRPVKSAVK